MNQATLVGHLGNDPEVSEFDGGRVARFRLATNRRWKGKEHTDWHSVKVFGPLVGVVEQYVKKGGRLLVVGRIEYRESDGKYFTDIIAQDIELL